MMSRGNCLKETLMGQGGTAKNSRLERGDDQDDHGTEGAEQLEKNDSDRCHLF